MTKRDILVLVVPLFVFVCICAALFGIAGLVSNRTSFNESWSQRNYDDAVKIENGDHPLPPQKVIEIIDILRRPQTTRDQLDHLLSDYLRRLAWVGCGAFGLQLYAISRVYAKYRKRAA